MKDEAVFQPLPRHRFLKVIKKISGRLIHRQTENDSNRPAETVLPKLKGKLLLSREIEALINDPVYPTEEQLKDPRIQSLLDEEIH